MGYSQNLALGEIAYDGYHAIHEEHEFTPFEDLHVSEQEAWAQAARNACDAWNTPGGVDVAYWKKATREQHAELRAHRQQERQR